MSADDRARCAAMAGLLHGWGSLAALGLLMTAVALGGLAWLSRPAPCSFAWGAVALAGLAERILWLRLRLDLGLFGSLADGTIESLGTLDRALDSVGLRRPAAGAPRVLEARLAGTRRLMRQHAAIVGAQAVLSLLAMLLPGAPR